MDALIFALWLVAAGATDTQQHERDREGIARGLQCVDEAEHFEIARPHGDTTDVMIERVVAYCTKTIGTTYKMNPDALRRMLSEFARDNYSHITQR